MTPSEVNIPVAVLRGCPGEPPLPLAAVAASAFPSCPLGGDVRAGHPYYYYCTTLIVELGTLSCCHRYGVFALL